MNSAIMTNRGQTSLSSLRFLAMIVVAAGLSACAAPQGVNDDPLEPMNRAVHGFNKGVDTVVLRPASQVYGRGVPEPVRQGISNVGDVLGLPSVIANDILQAKFIDATNNTLRLGVNLTFGLGGLIDVASAAGMPEKSNDFGATLAAWGMGEGPYVEVPFYGPLTGRDAMGKVVDIALDPVGNALKGDDRKAYVKGYVGVYALGILDDRYRYSNTVDSLLYESADSYAQAKLLYLQNRRFTLEGADGSTVSDDEFIDPYEDINGQ